MHSYFLPHEHWHQPFILEGPQARHLLKVMRARPGERLRLFDGQGREGVFILDGHDRDKASLSPVSMRTLTRPGGGVHLALGWNKSSRRGWLLEKSVELQASGIVFWQAARSQGRVPDAAKSTWHDQCVAAAKQCGTAWLPRLETVPGGIRDLVDRYADFKHRLVLWEDQDSGPLFDPGKLPGEEPAVLVLGPEGGLEKEEVLLFSEAGFSPVSLGRSILRWETAALLCLGLIYWHGQSCARKPQAPPAARSRERK